MTRRASRVRDATATLLTPPWRRAPLLLVRKLGLVAAAAGATAVVAASLSAVPLFASSVGSASIELQAGERCPRDTGVTRRFSAAAGGIHSPSADPFVAVTDRLGPSNWWARVKNVPLTSDDTGDDVVVSLLVRGGALEHVDVIDSRQGPGVWLSDRAAERADLRAGSFASIGPTRVAVAGVFRDFAGASVDGYWCSNADLLLPETSDFIPPPPLVLVDRATLARVMQGLSIERAEGAWEAGLRPGLTVTEADALLGTLVCRDGEDVMPWCSSGHRPRVASGAFDPSRGRLIDSGDENEFARRFLESSLPFALRRTHATQTSVGAGVWAIAALATLAGLGLVAAVAALWADRRRREIALLTVRGISRAALGLKAALEVVIPVIAGAAIGVGVAHLSVTTLGPSGDVEMAALRLAAVTGAAAAVVSLATVSIVVAARVDRISAPRLRSRWARLVPWEVALAAITVISFHRLGEWGVPIGRGAAVTRVDLWGLLFPVLFLVTAVATVARLLALGVRPLLAASRGWPMALYLGVRRVARYRVAAIGLVAGASLAAGVLGYAATMNRSLASTLHAKGHTFVGSDVAIQLADDGVVPASLASRATTIRSYRDATLSIGRRQTARVLVVDPDTFGRAAFWDPSFSSIELDEILRRLDPGRADGVIPAAVVGMRLDGPTELVVVGQGRSRVEIDPIADVETMPGMRAQEPTVYLSDAVLGRLPREGYATEAWLRGDRDQLLHTLEESGTGFGEVRTITNIADRAAFHTVSWTFGFFTSIGLAAGVLVLGGLAVYLDAQRRQRVLGYAFMRRMGLRRTQHRRALLVELTASVALGAALGLAAATGAAAFAYERIDPATRYAPAPLLRHATTTIGVVAVVTALVTLLSAAVGQRRIDRDDPVEVLRAGA